jgi:hypothetical protein
VDGKYEACQPAIGFVKAVDIFDMAIAEIGHNGHNVRTL